MRQSSTRIFCPFSPDHYGAGIYADENGQNILVEDCVIADNVASRGAGARFGSYRRCRFLNNIAYSWGSAARECDLYSCFIKGNEGISEKKTYTIYNAGVIDGCTFGANTDTYQIKPSSRKNVVRNTMIASGNAEISYAQFVA